MDVCLSVCVCVCWYQQIWLIKKFEKYALFSNCSYSIENVLYRKRIVSTILQHTDTEVYVSLAAHEHNFIFLHYYRDN